MEVKNIIAEIKEKMEQRGGLKHVYFVACGGSKAADLPGPVSSAVRGEELQRYDLYQQRVCTCYSGGAGREMPGGDLLLKSYSGNR